MVHALGALLKIGPHYGQGGECTKSEEILPGTVLGKVSFNCQYHRYHYCMMMDTQKDFIAYQQES